VELAATAEGSLPRTVIDAAVQAAAPTGQALWRLAQVLAADPGALQLGAPPIAGRLAAELIARGSATLAVPRCARCGRTGKPLFTSDAGGVCQRCRAWQLAAPCSACGRVKPVAVRGEAGQPLCEVCRRHAGRASRHCGTCGKTAPIAVRGRDGKPDVCVNCYKLPEAICAVCGRRRECNFAATGHPVCPSCSPRAALNWLRRSHGAALLADLASGALPATHQALDADPRRRAADFLRHMLTAGGVLPPATRNSPAPGSGSTASSARSSLLRRSGWSAPMPPGR
jgi:hypothetical protein